MKRMIDSIRQRKEYMTPMTEIYQLADIELLAGSGVGNDGLGIGYGGIDDNGEIEPSSRLLEDMLGDGNLLGF